MTHRKRTPLGAAALLAVAVVAALALTACERQSRIADAFAEPIVAGTTCAADGMLLLNHPGPKGQIVYTDGSRAFFCDVREVFEALHDPEQAHRVATAFVQPMDGRSWESHPDGWADAQGLVYVLGSARMGHMGPTMVPFHAEDAARGFMAEHGGRMLAARDLTEPAVAAYVREARNALRQMDMSGGTGNGERHDMGHGAMTAPHGMPGTSDTAGTNNIDDTATSQHNTH